MNMISDARGGHVSPGIYTEEKDVTYSVKSLGITSLGLAGETLYGPAFEPIDIKDWSEFVDYFGGTSPEKFKGTGYPKYPLPYVAKSYLEESKRLSVVRVLGLSGYKAGKVFALNAEEWNSGTTSYTGTKKFIGTLRSKMTYSGSTTDICDTGKTDSPIEVVETLEIVKYQPAVYDSHCATVTGSTATSIEDRWKFGIKVTVTTGAAGYNNVTYNVSLNPNDSDYIYNIIDKNSPIYIEGIYENAIDFDNYGINVTGSPVTTISDADYLDFFDGYRYAQTPWLVSEAYASTDGTKTEVKANKLFRFITISDGDAANTQIKVSIQNIKIEDGYFDVVVRDFYDTDDAPVILEKFSKCSMTAGDSSYVAFKIGTADGGYESKSKYIAVEMANDEGEFNGSVPCGFVGYPMFQYGTLEMLKVAYNTTYNPEKKAKKQYFGLSSDVIDTDLFQYKGRKAYDNIARMTNGFHLDSIFSHVTANTDISIDGISGYTFTCVSPDKNTNVQYEPRMINAPAYLSGSIYNDINLRKFTVCFCGGFDGWDIYRDERTNAGATYKSTNYYAEYNINTGCTPGSGSCVFRKVAGSKDYTDYGYLNLPANAITSDYYAYLAGYRAFANPQDVDINLFATPGINWIDHTPLTEDVIELIEDKDDGRGGDALYIMDSPTGFTADELAMEFDNQEFNSSYACTYGPCIMYYDNSNKKYLTLPVTKDVVRNMAATDNNSFPWFAPAGMERGNVNCVKAEYKTTLAQEDELYENNINPVKTFAQDGVKIWGNKTAYRVDSPLNRINVRRLMIRVQKLIKEAAKNLIFEQYDDTLEKQFKGLVDPILADVKSNRGIYDYRIITECTEETRDQHILPAKILIKPTPALEYISISFVVYPESVAFDE